MAKAITLRYGVQSLLLSDGASEPEFTAPCGITSLTRTSNIATNTSEEPDCDDLDAPIWLTIDLTSKQWVVTGGGIFAQQAIPTWRDWDYALEGSDVFKEVRWYTDLTAENGGGYFQGDGLLTTFEEVGARNQRWAVNFGVTFDGRPTRVPAP